MPYLYGGEYRVAQLVIRLDQQRFRPLRTSLDDMSFNDFCYLPTSLGDR